jgi:glucose uptake protein GlcU
MTASIILGIIAILICLCGLFCTDKTDKKGYKIYYWILIFLNIICIGYNIYKITNGM